MHKVCEVMGYFINTYFFISVYKITVYTPTQKWFTKSMSYAHMLWKIEYILICLHVRRNWDNAPFHKVLWFLLSFCRESGTSGSSRGTWRVPGINHKNVPWLKSTWGFPFVFLCGVLLQRKKKKVLIVPKKIWIHESPLISREGGQTYPPA